MRRVLIPCAVLLALAIALLSAGMFMPSVAGAAAGDETTPPPVQQQNGHVMRLGESVWVAEDQVVDDVVVVGGNATIAGTVTQHVVVFGGDVHVLPTAVVGDPSAPSDTAITAMGGTITVDPGASVTGQLVDEAFWKDPINRPHFDGPFDFSFFGWFVWTAVLVVLGLVAAALLPRQMTAIGRMMGRRLGASFGWGALTFFIVVPVAAVLLLITIIGILVLIPALVVVPLFYFFASISVATYIVQRLLKGSERQQNLMLTTTLGVVATSILVAIPVAGGLVLLVMILLGTGGAVLSLLEWRQQRRMRPVPGGGTPGGEGYPPQSPYQPVPPQPGAGYAPVPATSPTAVTTPQGGAASGAEPAAPETVGAEEPTVSEAVGAEEPTASEEAPAVPAPPETPAQPEPPAPPVSPLSGSFEPTAVTMVGGEVPQGSLEELGTDIGPHEHEPVVETEDYGSTTGSADEVRTAEFTPGLEEKTAAQADDGTALASPGGMDAPASSAGHEDEDAE